MCFLIAVKEMAVKVSYFDFLRLKAGLRFNIPIIEQKLVCCDNC